MSDEAPNKTERKLNRSGDTQTLQGIVGDDVDDIDVFGYELIYTTGEFVVDRDQLLAKALDVGIPKWMLPSKVQPHHAFGRMIDGLLDGLEEVTHEGQRVQFDLRQNDSRYSYTLDASVYFGPEDTQSDDGEWVQHELGVLKYDNPENGEPRVRFVDRIEPDQSLSIFWGIVEASGEVMTDGLANYDSIAEASDAAALEANQTTFRARAEALFEKHQQSHIGKDVNNMVYYLTTTWTDSIKLRDACYFVPATHSYHIDGEEAPISDLIDAYSELYDWLDQNAEKPRFSQSTEMSVVEIMDTDRQRDMVEKKVEERLGDMASGLTDSVLDKLSQDDVMAETVAAEVNDTLDELTAIAGEYDDLLGSKKAELKTTNAVRRAVRSAMSELEEEQQDVVAEVIEETDADVDPLAEPSA